MKIEDKYKVLLADDHVLLREALSTMVNSLDEFVVTSSVDNGKQLIDALKSGHKPDLIILDLSMPVMDGFETARILSEEYPEQKTLILTMYDSEIALIRLLQDGVKGFLKKDIQPRELRTALLAVVEGGFYYSSQATGKLGRMIHTHHVNKTSLEKSFLSDREVEFLKYACTDKTYKEIAQDMKLTPRVVDCCRDTLFEKLDVKNRVGLAIYAIRHGLVRV
ncbi:MAG TPA: response regulator transcription factor [Ferruginibacter sp.]|jgi:DNA-binding NarL/FixJ family response regulator|nr:response regulator transcription factor [Ferruginibacter sp.]HRN92214.1 response regulator transcription factor [Ferruginibacter sp.]HRO06378.1 response regulator transcription factor [Ferruginibacter sp.]HRO97608.1 response regulator transcription factor [Ferruginibacter sp.]HRP50626.1 response regulator transcription factor [Ferruginibacter sp.]